ncbi:MAG: hypothetical protein CMN78_04360 [Spirochaetales bacterium]|nr:hypothetical protein [Spirochaetales bacterium]MAG13810.1 hypothetical protein [Spirochaetales bacterium]
MSIKYIPRKEDTMGNTVAAKKIKDALVGPVVAMTTTFNRDYSLDLGGMKALTDLYIDGGIKNVIVAGSTGEFFSMTDAERMLAIKAVVERSGGRMTVVGCAAHSGTQIAINLAKQCKDVGCDGIMVTPPYYSFSGVEGMLNHFRMISDAVDLGIVGYFSGSVLRFPVIGGMVSEEWHCPQAMLDIAAIPNVGAFKDASGNYGWHRDIVRALDGPDGEAAVMGSDGMGYHLWGHQYGSRCYLTGLGNVWPKIEVEFFDRLGTGDTNSALEIVNTYELDYLNVTKATGRYWSCLKFFLDELGLPGGPMRPPLLDCDEKDKANLLAFAEGAGLLPA